MTRSTLPAAFTVKVRGLSFIAGAPGLLGRLDALVAAGRPPALALVPEPDNAADPTAVAVRSAATGRHLGYVPRDLAARIAAEVDGGAVWEVTGYEVLVAPGAEHNPGLALTVRRRPA